jgi:hypothetical protein
MGPVTIAVDSYGPVTDNAQSVYELSMIEQVPNIKAELKKDFNVDANFERSKDLLEENDGAGNTFKATAKPVLIGTAVVGATTMIFSIIMALTNGLTMNVEKLSLLHAPFFLGLITGGAMIYWFTGASMQAVTTGAYRAVEFIKANIKLEGATKASVADSKKVVEICTKYAQKGMFNIFLAVFFGTLTFAFVEPFFFIGYLISIAIFGLYQAIFMANAGAAWDNAKKIVETKLKQKGTPLHDATVIGDTVGDPFKDTSSVAMNPVIKFTTLFGLLAVELAVSLTNDHPGNWADARPGGCLLRGVGVLRVPVVLRDADQFGVRFEQRAKRRNAIQHRGWRFYCPCQIPAANSKSLNCSRCQLAADGTQQFFRRFSGVLAGEVFVQNEQGDGGIDFLQRLAGRLAMHGLHACGNDHQLCLGCLEQDAGVVDGRGGQGVVSGAAQDFAQERAHIGRLANAKHARARVAFSARIARA